MKMLIPNGPRIAALRKERGLTQFDCKVDPKTLRKVEQGKAVRETVLRSLADDVLRVPLETIVHATEVAGVRELDFFRAEWRKNDGARDIIITDQHAYSNKANIKTLTPVDEGFVDVIRGAQILKWHVDLIHPTDEKIEYLAKVGRLVDELRNVVKGVSGSHAVLSNERRIERIKEVDHSFSQALNAQRKIIELKALMRAGPDQGIKFLWLRYTFWGQECDFAGGHDVIEQSIRLVVATDTDRDIVAALVHTGAYTHDEPDPGEPLEGGKDVTSK